MRLRFIALLPVVLAPLSAAAAAAEPVTAGLDLRLRGEALDHPDGTDDPVDTYLFQRAMPWLRYDGDGVRLNLRAIAATVHGLRADPGPPDRTGLDLLEATAGIDLLQADDFFLSATAGREMLKLGSERLIGRRYGANVPQPYQGGRLTLSGADWQADILAERPVATSQGDFDDGPAPGRHLSGAYGSVQGAYGSMDLYLLFTGQDDARYTQGRGRERRRTAGMRLSGSRDAWSWNWEAMIQRGHFAGTGIHAWSLASETGYMLAGLPLSPRLLLRANIASGDHDPGDGRLGTFNPLYPRAKYFGELTPIGPRNMINLHPGLELDLGGGFDLQLAAIAYWRESRWDGAYSLPGTLLSAADPDAGRHVGNQAEMVLGWEREGLSVAASFSVFAPGRFLSRTGRTRTIRMAGLELGWTL